MTLKLIAGDSPYTSRLCLGWRDDECNQECSVLFSKAKDYAQGELCIWSMLVLLYLLPVLVDLRGLGLFIWDMRPCFFTECLGYHVYTYDGR